MVAPGPRLAMSISKSVYTDAKAFGTRKVMLSGMPMLSAQSWEMWMFNQVLANLRPAVVANNDGRRARSLHIVTFIL